MTVDSYNNFNIFVTIILGPIIYLGFYVLYKIFDSDFKNGNTNIITLNS